MRGSLRAVVPARRAVAILLAGALLPVLVALPAHAATFVVNSTSDAVDGNVGNGQCRTSGLTGVCTLRAAIQEANATAAADTISLPSGTFAITRRGTSNTTGDFDITRPVSIVGANTATSIIDAGAPVAGSPPDVRGLDRLLEIHPGAGNVTFSKMTIRDGYHAEMGGGIQNASTGTLVLQDVVLRNSYAGKYGGGVNNAGGGTVRLIRSTLTENGAVEGGAAINNATTGRIEILQSSSVSGNPGTYPIEAGAIHNEGQNDSVGVIVVRDSTVAQNRAQKNGAGINNDGDGTLLIERSTVRDNTTPSSGGGIYTVSGSLTIDDSTISGNQAGTDDGIDESTGDGGGIYSAGRSTKAGVPGSIRIEGTRFAGNKATGDGGAIAGGLDSVIEITDTDFDSNVANSDGGGISSQAKTSMVMTAVRFLGNRAGERGGGAYIYSAGFVGITVSTFSGNTAGEDGGGGLYTDGSGIFSIVGSAFTGNVAVGDGGGIAIHSSGDVVIDDADVLNNRSTAENGGGIENSGMLVALVRSTVAGNVAALDGGGVHNTSGGEFTVEDAAVSGNTAENGGGIANASDGTLLISRSLLNGNRAKLALRNDSGLGGGLYSIGDGGALLENTTISGNRADGVGGGIYDDADAETRLVGVTITLNNAPLGSGFGISETDFVPTVPATPDPSVFLRNTIIAGNLGSSDCDNPLTSERGNLDDGTSCGMRAAGDRSNADPKLGPLADNGGPTKTHALQTGSAAVGGGVAPCGATDQRGVTRPNAGCDVGAFESSSGGGGACPGQVSVKADADGWVLQSSPQQNYGTDGVAKVDSKVFANARGLFRFALPRIPTGCDILDAKLRLYASSYKDGRTLQALRLASGWTEASVSWDNQPATSGPAAVTSSGSGYRQWTVVAQVEAMYALGNNGFLVRDASENGIGVDQGFNTREKGIDNPPQLVLVIG
jgi:CSLREA domain-containing protein